MENNIYLAETINSSSDLHNELGRRAKCSRTHTKHPHIPRFPSSAYVGENAAASAAGGVEFFFPQKNAKKVRRDTFTQHLFCRTAQTANTFTTNGVPTTTTRFPISTFICKQRNIYSSLCARGTTSCSAADSFPTSVRVRLKCGLHPVPLPGQRASDPGAGESKQGLVSSSPGTKPSRFGVLLDSGISKGGGESEMRMHFTNKLILFRFYIDS